MEDAIRLVENFRGKEFPHSMHKPQILLTPKFWDGLVKATFWWPDYSKFKTTKYDGRGMHYAYEEPYVNLWKRFIDHLAEGKDTESFFQELLSSRK